MARLATFFSIISIALFLSGCHLIFHPAVEQGNRINASQLAHIQPGMTEQQVLQTLGSPVMTNMYADNRLVYVYALTPSRGEATKKQVYIYFQNGRVSHYNSNLNTQPPKPS